MKENLQTGIHTMAEAVLGNDTDRSQLGNLVFGFLKFARLIPADPPPKPKTPGLT